MIFLTWVSKRVHMDENIRFPANTATLASLFHQHCLFSAIEKVLPQDWDPQDQISFKAFPRNDRTRENPNSCHAFIYIYIILLTNKVYNISGNINLHKNVKNIF